MLYYSVLYGLWFMFISLSHRVESSEQVERNHTSRSDKEMEHFQVSTALIRRRRSSAIRSSDRQTTMSARLPFSQNNG